MMVAGRRYFSIPLIRPVLNGAAAREDETMTVTIAFLIETWKISISCCYNMYYRQYPVCNACHKPQRTFIFLIIYLGPSVFVDPPLYLSLTRTRHEQNCRSSI